MFSQEKEGVEQVFVFSLLELVYSVTDRAGQPCVGGPRGEPLQQ